MDIAINPSDQVAQHVILQGVSWETYTRLLADFEDSHAAHFTYDRGVLEIMVLSAKPEEANRTIALLIEILALELEIDVRNLGSTTFKRADLFRGFEPDTCFYVQNAARIADKEELDLTVDPPPDLVIEIDITHPSLDKLPIYAEVGVSEIWRYDGTAVTIYILEGNTYLERENSAALPQLSCSMLLQFIADSKRLARTAWLRSIRNWVHSRTPDDTEV